MSGHSKWSKIQHKKGKKDAKRGDAFTKLCKAITVAAQQGGGDPEMNFSLRLAVQKAKQGNVPKDNIERAIKRGTGELADGAQIQELLYEGYGPGGIAILIEALTDNTNRTVSDVKHALTKHGGSLAGPGSVKWQFEQLGVSMIAAEKKESIDDWDSLELALMDAGADDIIVSEGGVEIRSSRDAFKSVVDAIAAAGIEPDESGLMWVAKEAADPGADNAKKMETLYAALDELDDVKEVYTNEA